MQLKPINFVALQGQFLCRFQNYTWYVEMLGVRQRLIYPSFNYARIQYLTGLTHGHDVLYTLLEVSPVS